MSNPWASSFDEYRQTIIGEKKRWQDDDGDGKWYEKSDVDGKISKREKKSKKHDCASKVKHEQFGIGNPVKGMHDLDENGVVQHYDVFFEHGIEKNIPVSSLEILEGHMHEHVIREGKGKKNCGCGQDPCITYGKKQKAVKEHHTKDCDDNCEPNCEHDKALGEDAKYGYDKDGNSLNPKDKKKAKKVKKESFSDWRTDLREIMTDDEEQKEIKEKNVKNKIKINPKLGEAIEEIGGEVLEAYTVTKADKKGNTPAWQGYKSGKKNVKTGKPLYKAADHLKNEEVEEFEESEKVAQGAQKRAEVLASRRRQKGYREKGYNAYRPGKNEKAGYNLSRAARSSDASAETQRTKKKKPAGEDTSQIGHYKKRDEKQTVGKRGKPLKQPKYKLSLGQRVDHHSNKAMSRRDPKQNPKHTANK